MNTSGRGVTITGDTVHGGWRDGLLLIQLGVTQLPG